MLLALSPGASEPRMDARASLKSPVEMPLRYSTGIKASRLGTRRRNGGQNLAGKAHLTAAVAHSRAV